MGLEINQDVASTLFGKTRRELLSLFLGRPDERFYFREIVRRVNGGVGAVQRELAELGAAGIIGKTLIGRSAFYQANRTCPVFGELQSIVTKTAGVSEIIRGALAALQQRIDVAFIFGSIARGQQSSQSDIDLILLPSDEKLTLTDVVRALRTVHEQAGREINPILYRRDEFQKKLRSKHHFLTRVMESPKVFIIGNDDELGRLVKARMAATVQAGSQRNRRAVRGRRARPARLLATSGAVVNR